MNSALLLLSTPAQDQCISTLSAFVVAAEEISLDGISKLSQLDDMLMTSFDHAYNSRPDHFVSWQDLLRGMLKGGKVRASAFRIHSSTAAATNLR